MTRSSIMKYFFAGLSLALATFLGFILFIGSPAPLVLGVEHVKLTERQGSDLSAPIQAATNRTRNSLNEYSQRPLFTEDRRPVPAANADETGAALSIKVVGLTISSRTSIAVLERNNSTQLRAVVGDELDGWTITGIARDRVTFERDGDEIEVQLSKPGE